MSRVLLVDDDDSTFYIIKRMMNSSFPSLSHIDRCNNGQEALEYFEKVLPEAGGNLSNMPDLVVLDITMPVMDGFAFLDRYSKLLTDRNFPPNLEPPFFLILSSSNQAKDQVRAKGFSCVKKYLTKPIKKSVLEELVREYCPVT